MKTLKGLANQRRRCTPVPGDSPPDPLPRLEPKVDAKSLANQRDAPGGSALGVLEPGFSGVHLLTAFCK